ncbi:hypothetical protein HBZS_103310 [Helicobacter bizzozeronii CCUG 35545]|nr:hypothetical protein HBZS_103310 [Helicobacter bizzozeronii CCUG 35545]
MRGVFWVVLLSLIFFGCNARKNFTPPASKIKGDLSFSHPLSDSIVFTNRYGAILKNGGVIDLEGITPLKLGKDLDKETSFLNQSQDYYILARDCWRTPQESKTKAPKEKNESPHGQASPNRDRREHRSHRSKCDLTRSLPPFGTCGDL